MKKTNKLTQEQIDTLQSVHMMFIYNGLLRMGIEKVDQEEFLNVAEITFNEIISEAEERLLDLDKDEALLRSFQEED